MFSFLFSIMTQKVSCWQSVNSQFLLVSQLRDAPLEGNSSLWHQLLHFLAQPWRGSMALAWATGSPDQLRSATGALREHFDLESWGSSLLTKHINFKWSWEDPKIEVLIPQVERCGHKGMLASCFTRSRESVGKSLKAKLTLFGWFDKTCLGLWALHCHVFSSSGSLLALESTPWDHLQFSLSHPLTWLLPPYLLISLLPHFHA